MAKRLVTRADGEILFKVKRTHPFLGCFGRVLGAAFLIYGPLAIPSPWVYFLAPTIYGLEFIVYFIICSPKKKDITASESQEENYHGSSP